MFKYLLRKVNQSLFSGYNQKLLSDSPFLQGILSDVIENNSMYYAFDSIEDNFKVSSNQKYYGRLVFKLLNSLKLSTSMFICECNDPSYLYAAKVSSKNSVLIKNDDLNRTEFPKNIKKVDTYTNDKIDLLYLNSDSNLYNFKHFKQNLTSKSVMVVCNINKCKENKYNWLKITEDKDVSQTIDIYSIGLAFFDKELPKENFKIRYII